MGVGGRRERGKGGKYCREEGGLGSAFLGSLCCSEATRFDRYVYNDKRSDGRGGVGG